MDQSKFRRCSQTAFCRQHRRPLSGELKHEPVHVVKSELQLSQDNRVLLFDLEQTEGVLLQATVQALKSGSIRFRVVEKTPLNGPRWEPKDIVPAPEDMETCPWKQIQDFNAPGITLDDLSVVFTKDCGNLNDWAMILSVNPFNLQVIRDQKVIVSVNSKGLFHFQHHRAREEGVNEAEMGDDEEEDIHQGKKIVDYGEDGLAIYEDGTTQTKRSLTKETESNEGDWEEKFGSYTDAKQYGPSSVGLDIGFPQAENVYGIPEHASDFALKTTRGEEYDEPFRLYNLDVFEYDLDVPMALYGAIPMMHAHSLHGTAAIFWNNPSETFIDIENAQGNVDRGDLPLYKHTHWMSESGVIDLFIFPGPSVKGILKDYTALTGTPYLPPLWSIAYHQCRWNYKSEEDVAKVNAKFEEAHIPMDVIWLDIEHTDGKRYFTWDSKVFPTPVDMINNVAYYGRKMVTIVDPHIKRDDDYPVHKDATEQGVYVKKSDGVTDFDGWCWPGSSSYVDFTSPRARKWWAERFRFDKYLGSTNDLYTWNDMNEPSVFNGVEVSMAKECKNLDGAEHREWHNLYGMYMQQATMEGLLLRQQNQPGLEMPSSHRPFVLSRSFYAGAQKFGSIWTGDNESKWSHLNYATKMLLSMSSVSLSFVGADVGGFFGNPEPELMLRWLQAAAFQPFFRGHAHHDAKRREPYVFDDPIRSHLCNAIRSRYFILPYMYTLFHEASQTGTPVMRPLWMEFERDTKVFKTDHQYMLGPALLVQPVVEPNVVQSNVYLPEEGSVWYNYWTLEKLSGGKEYTVASKLDSIPVFQRGGTIIPKKLRVRRSSQLMRHDPYSLFVALDSNAEARGEIYLDDEITMQYQTGQFNVRQLQWSNGILSCTSVAKSSYVPTNTVERIVVMGFHQIPKAVSQEGTSLTFEYDTDRATLTIRKPDVVVGSDWKIQVTW